MNSYFRIFTAIYLSMLANHTFGQWVQITIPDCRWINAFAAKDNFVFAGTDSGVFRSNDNGTSWTEVNSGIVNKNVQSLAVEGNAVFAGTRKGVYITRDNGKSWSVCTAGLINESVRSMVLRDSTIYYGTEDKGIFISQDYGGTLASANPVLPGYFVEFLSVNNTTIYAGTYLVCSACLPAFTMFKSTNDGEHWTADTFFDDNWASSIVASGNNFFAGTYAYGVFRSSGGSPRWTAANHGLTDIRIFSLVTNDGILFAGTCRSGVFISIDNASSWSPFSTGLTDTLVSKLAVCNGNLFAITADEKIWRSSLSEKTLPEKKHFYRENDVQLRFHRYGSKITMTLSVNHSDNISVEMYDLAGRKIGLFCNKYFKPGSYTCCFDTDIHGLNNVVVKLQTSSGSSAKMMRIHE